MAKQIKFGDFILGLDPDLYIRINVQDAVEPYEWGHTAYSPYGRVKKLSHLTFEKIKDLPVVTSLIDEDDVVKFEYSPFSEPSIRCINPLEIWLGGASESLIGELERE